MDLISIFLGLFYGEHIKENFVDYILKEYDHSHSGVGLSEKDFIQFADNLFTLYERSHVERREISKVNDWYIDHQLGKGGHGVVKCVVNLQSHEKRALKIVKGICYLPITFFILSFFIFFVYSMFSVFKCWRNVEG